MDTSDYARGVALAGKLLRYSELFTRELELCARDPEADVSDPGFAAVLEEASIHLENAGEVLRGWRIRRCQ